MKYRSHHFKSIWVHDFEFYHENLNNGNPVVPICVVAIDLISGKKIRMWLEDGRPEAPYSTGPESLFINFFGSAEATAHLALNWPLPEKVVDLFAEFRCLHNGRYFNNDPKKRWSLLSALKYYHLDGMREGYKTTMTDRILQGPPYTTAERSQILKYCEQDVLSTAALFQKMLPDISLSYALMRGAYSIDCGKIMHRGIPLDPQVFNTLDQQWGDIQLKLISEIDKDYQVYENGHFRMAKFIEYLTKHNIWWPQTPTGLPRTDGDTFKEMSIVHPQLLPLKELRVTIDQLKLKKIQVGDDYRNRCLLSQFSTITARNAPSTSKYVFGTAVWLRHLIKPAADMALCYLDFDQQEYAVGAVLSHDVQMQRAYASGDPYMQFARDARAVPQNATKKTHPGARELYKQCTLALGFGMGFRSFARRINKSESAARRLIEQHKKTYSTFWAWSDSVVQYANAYGSLETIFGWRIQWPFNNKPFEDQNPRRLRNWPIQSAASEMLRLAVHKIHKQGIPIVALVHDAIMIESPASEIEQAVAISTQEMVEASKTILNGFEVSVDTKTVRFPERYSDPRGTKLWGTMTKILEV